MNFKTVQDTKSKHRAATPSLLGSTPLRTQKDEGDTSA